MQALKGLGRYFYVAEGIEAEGESEEASEFPEDPQPTPM